MILTQRVFDLLFPEKCVLCGKVLEKEEMDLCHRCRVEAPDCPVSGKKLSFVDSWAAVWYYEDTARKSLLRSRTGSPVPIRGILCQRNRRRLQKSSASR